MGGAGVRAVLREGLRGRLEALGLLAFGLVMLVVGAALGGCRCGRAIPRYLRRIANNTAKPRQPK